MIVKLLAAGALAVGSLGSATAFMASPAADVSVVADSLCTSASYSGVAGSNSFGPYCVPYYPLGVHCEYVGAGLDPTFGVKASTCVPRP